VRAGRLGAVSSWAASYAVIVTFAEGVLRLVRAGPRVEVDAHLDPNARADAAAAETLDSVAEAPDDAAAFAVVPSIADQASEAAAAQMAAPGPGFADIEAAVLMVNAGLATRVVLTGFPSWPGLLWQAYQLAESSGVVILPAVVLPGGRVDIVIERDPAADV
jgi:hypothetical protein